VRPIPASRGAGVDGDAHRVFVRVLAYLVRVKRGSNLPGPARWRGAAMVGVTDPMERAAARLMAAGDAAFLVTDASPTFDGGGHRGATSA
jgi:hypothetical protein